MDAPTESPTATGREASSETAAAAGGAPRAEDTAEPSGPIESRAPAAAPPRVAAERQAAILGPAIGTWLRYLVPLTLLSALALSPLLAIALTARAPADLAAAKSLVRLGWTLLAMAWLGQLLLVGGASAMIDAKRSQLRALGAGFAQMVRAVVPCLVATAAVVIGCLALVVPGPILLVLLSLTAASRERGLPAPLLDSISVARRQLAPVILAVLALFAIDAAIGLFSHRVLIAALPAKPTPAQLASVRNFVRVIALALVVASPLPATILATIRWRESRREPQHAATQAKAMRVSTSGSFHGR